MAPQILAADGGFHPPSLTDFFPPAVLFEGTPFELNRIMLIRILIALVLCVVLVMIAKRATLIPNKVQSVFEMGLDFVRTEIAEQFLGADARRFLPFLATLFFGISAFNITGIIPGFNMASTALFGLPLLLSVWVYLVYLAAGVQRQGLWGYLKTNMFPAGVPVFLYPLITPIELLQIFVIRPATLAIRLTANMIAGHLLLVLCFSATQTLIMHGTSLQKGIGVFALAGGLIFTLFEILVAFLQAYVFTLLAAVYISMALEAAH